MKLKNSKENTPNSIKRIEFAEVFQQDGKVYIKISFDNINFNTIEATETNINRINEQLEIQYKDEMKNIKKLQAKVGLLYLGISLTDRKDMVDKYREHSSRLLELQIIKYRDENQETLSKLPKYKDILKRLKKLTYCELEDPLLAIYIKDIDIELLQRVVELISEREIISWRQDILGVTIEEVNLVKTLPQGSLTIEDCADIKTGIEVVDIEVADIPQKVSSHKVNQKKN